VTAVATRSPVDVPGGRVHPRIEEAFTSLDGAGVAWALLRGADDLADPRGDVDVLVAPGSLRDVRVALAQAGFGQMPFPGRGSHRFFVGLDASRPWLTLDVVDDLAFGRWAELDTRVAAACLRRRTRDADGPWLLFEDDAVWAELLHLLLDPAALSGERADRAIVAGARAARVATDGPLAAWLASVDPAAGGTIVGALGDEPAARVDAARARARSALRAGVRRAPLRSLARALRTIVRRRLSRLPIPYRRRGLVVALLGPDGAGKSSVAARLGALSPLAVRSFYMGAYPQAEARRGGIAASVPGIAFGRRLARLMGRAIAARIHAWRGGIAVLDRHPAESRLDGRGSLRRRLLAAAVPDPDLFLVLDAPATLVRDRKPEWPLATIERQLAGYRALATRPNARRIDASRPLDEVARATMAAIWDARTHSSLDGDAGPAGAADADRAAAARRRAR
jgi:hypothetical protein